MTERSDVEWQQSENALTWRNKIDNCQGKRGSSEIIELQSIYRWKLAISIHFTNNINKKHQSLSRKPKYVLTDRQQQHQPTNTDMAHAYE